jgi:hypothetical protein
MPCAYLDARCSPAPPTFCHAQGYRRCDTIVPCSICGAPSLYHADLIAYCTLRCAHGYTVEDGGKVVRIAETE